VSHFTETYGSTFTSSKRGLQAIDWDPFLSPCLAVSDSSEVNLPVLGFFPLVRVLAMRTFLLMHAKSLA